MNKEVCHLSVEGRGACTKLQASDTQVSSLEHLRCPRQMQIAKTSKADV